MRVLLIEDEPTTAKSIELMLGTEGFNVYTTDLGEEGLDLGKLYDGKPISIIGNFPYNISSQIYFQVLALGAGACGVENVPEVPVAPGVSCIVVNELSRVAARQARWVARSAVFCRSLSLRSARL